MDYGGRPVRPAGQPRAMVRRSSRGHPRRLAKTSARAGYIVHRSPAGYIYLATNQGTLALRPHQFSAAVREASKPKPAAISA